MLQQCGHCCFLKKSSESCRLPRPPRFSDSFEQEHIVIICQHWKLESTGFLASVDSHALFCSWVDGAELLQFREAGQVVDGVKAPSLGLLVSFQSLVPCLKMNAICLTRYFWYKGLVQISLTFRALHCFQRARQLVLKTRRHFQSHSYFKAALLWCRASTLYLYVSRWCSGTSQLMTIGMMCAAQCPGGSRHHNERLTPDLFGRPAYLSWLKLWYRCDIFCTLSNKSLKQIEFIIHNLVPNFTWLLAALHFTVKLKLKLICMSLGGGLYSLGSLDWAHCVITIARRQVMYLSGVKSSLPEFWSTAYAEKVQCGEAEPRRCHTRKSKMWSYVGQVDSAKLEAYATSRTWRRATKWNDLMSLSQIG